MFKSEKAEIVFGNICFPSKKMAIDCLEGIVWHPPHVAINVMRVSDRHQVMTECTKEILSKKEVFGWETLLPELLRFNDSIPSSGSADVVSLAEIRQIQIAIRR